MTHEGQKRGQDKNGKERSGGKRERDIEREREREKKN